MDEIQSLLSFAWHGTKKGRWTNDKWGDVKNCRPLKDSTAKANALLTGRRQLSPSGHFKLIAVDLDHKDNWDEVLSTYKALELPQSLTVATPSGGYHIFFWIPKKIPAQTINDDRHCRNFELKGDMSNITAPGSVFDDGLEYRVVRDIPIAILKPVPAQRLCRFKQEAVMPIVPEEMMPERAAIQDEALRIDERARRNTRGYQLRCPYHEDSRSSAVLFYSGWLYCSGCGEKQLLVKKEVVR